MTSHEQQGEKNQNDGDDVTLAAGGDVVAQIRAHAARVRSGKVSAGEEIDVWTAEPAPVSPEPPSGKLLPHDETVAFTASLPAAALKAGREATTGSLIDGLTPPEASTSFWTTDQPFRASGIDLPERSWRGGVPLAAWVALAVLLIILASVAIAVAIASTGPIT